MKLVTNPKISKPFVHQLTARRKIIDWMTQRSANSYGALFMEMGTGKTKTSLDIIKDLVQEKKINAVLVVAPNRVHTQWINQQIPEHADFSYVSHLWEKSKTKKNIRELDEFLNLKTEKVKIFVTHIDRFSQTDKTALAPVAKFLSSHDTIFILDEATRIKNPNSKRTKKIISIGVLAKYRLILTGMKITNYPFDVFGPCEFLNPRLFGCNFFMFKHRYGIMKTDYVNDKLGSRRKFGRLITKEDYEKIIFQARSGKPDEYIAVSMGMSLASVKYLRKTGNFSPYKNLEELKNILEPFSFTITKKECLDLPEKIYQKIEIEMTTEQKRIYNQLKYQLLAEYRGKELTAATRLTLITRLQQVTSGFFPYAEEHTGEIKNLIIGETTEKCNALLEDIEEAGDQKIIVWSRFVHEIEHVAGKIRATGRSVGMYYGKNSPAHAEKIKKQFESGGLDVLVANPQSGAVGLNFQIATLHYFLSNLYDIEMRMQSEDRSHRIGQENHVTYKDIVVKDTIDDTIAEKLYERKNLVDFFMSKKIEEIII